MGVKTIAIVLSIVLIILQIISFIGMNQSYTSLYLDASDVFSYVFDYSGLNIKKLLFAIPAGLDSFIYGITAFLDNEGYVALTANQYASAYIRESLKYEGISLFIYDAFLTISYGAAGLTGIILLCKSLFSEE